MKVAFLVFNPFTDACWTDPRPDKQSRALIAAGHEVVILGSGKYGQDPVRREVKDGRLVVRCPTILHRLYVWWHPPPMGHHGSKNRQAYYRYERSPRLIDYFLQFMSDFNSLLFAPAVVGEAIRQRADVYVGVGLPGLIPAYLAVRRVGARLVYDSLELWTERQRGVPYGSWHKAAVAWLEGFLCRHCDLVLTMSDSVGEILAKKYGIPKPLTIPNVQPFEEVQRSEEVRAQLTGGRDVNVAICVGYLDYGRGLEELIDAAAYLDDVLIVLAGDGVLRPALEARVRERGLNERVRFIGWVPSDRVTAYVAAADVGVTAIQRRYLNCYYTLDNKIFSYIMAGVPVAASDHPEKRRLIERYGIGVTFDERDPRDIARGIREIFSDPIRYVQMRHRCLKAAREELNWEAYAGRYVQAMERIASAVTRHPAS